MTLIFAHYQMFRYVFDFSLLLSSKIKNCFDVATLMSVRWKALVVIMPHYFSFFLTILKFLNVEDATRVSME